MLKKEKKLFYFLFISHIYCLISGGFNGGDKMNYPSSFFGHFLAWWCTGNSILTLGFLLGKLIKRPKTDTYFHQLISLIVMISNLITMVIYGVGLIIGLITGLTTYGGFTARTKKGVPIPSHVINSSQQLFKVIQGGLYSPLWHFIAPIYFIYGFFHYSETNLLKKKLKLTILFCLIQPALYYSYGYFRSRLVNEEYTKNFGNRGVLPFLSSKKMTEKLGFDRDYRFIWKIILVIFGFSLFSLIVYFVLRYRRKIRNYLTSKKEILAKKKKKKNTHFLKEN